MADKYDTMDLEALHEVAYQRILSGRPGFAKSHARGNYYYDAFAVVEAMGEARGNQLYKCGCTLTAYPHDGCYHCEFYKVKFSPDYPADVAGASSETGEHDVGLPGVIFRAALRALDWDATQERR